jgi:hypothetical protein
MKRVWIVVVSLILLFPAFVNVGSLISSVSYAYDGPDPSNPHPIPPIDTLNPWSDTTFHPHWDNPILPIILIPSIHNNK